MTIRQALATNAGLRGYAAALAERHLGPLKGRDLATAVAGAIIASDPATLGAKGVHCIIVSIRCRRDGTLAVSPRFPWSAATLAAIASVAASVPGRDPSDIVIDGARLIGEAHCRNATDETWRAATYLRSIGQWSLARDIMDQGPEMRNDPAGRRLAVTGI